MKVQMIDGIERGNVEPHPACVTCVHLWEELWGDTTDTFSWQSLRCDHVVFCLQFCAWIVLCSSYDCFGMTRGQAHQVQHHLF